MVDIPLVPVLKFCNQITYLFNFNHQRKNQEVSREPSSDTLALLLSLDFKFVAIFKKSAEDASI
jgi:hypothetical protein